MIDTTEIQKTTVNDFENLYVVRLENLKDMDKFPDFFDLGKTERI